MAKKKVKEPICLTFNSENEWDNFVTEVSRYIEESYDDEGSTDIEFINIELDEDNKPAKVKIALSYTRHDFIEKNL